MKSFPIMFDLQEVLQENYYIYTRSEAKNINTTVGKVKKKEKKQLKSYPIYLAVLL